VKFKRAIYNPETAVMKNSEKRVKRGWVSVCITVGLVVAIVGGTWVGLVYSLGTYNPIMVVQGNSMIPTLNNGDLVIVKGVSASQLIDNYHQGDRDIIVFYSSQYGKYTVHRVNDTLYDKTGEFVGFITKGDNNYMADPGVVKSDSLVGKVISHIPYLGLIISFVRSVTGIFLVSLAIVVLAIWSFVEEINKRAKDKEAKSVNSQSPVS